MRLAFLTVAVLAVLAVGCATTPLGRDVPECGTDVSNTMILQVQSVPTAAYVACINGLKAGWDYEHAQIESGRSAFTLDSDRMGEPFITVELLPTCDVTGAAPEDSGQPDVELFKDVVSKTTVQVVLVPERPSEATTARALEVLTIVRDTLIKNREVVVSVSTSDDTTAERIGNAQKSGAHVIVISIRDAEEGTLSLYVAGSDEELEADYTENADPHDDLIRNLDDAVEEIEDAETEPSYRGNWYYVFDGGCVVYTFDAEGNGVSTIVSDIDVALGLYDAESLREFARNLGYNI